MRILFCSHGDSELSIIAQLRWTIAFFSGTEMDTIVLGQHPLSVTTEMLFNKAWEQWCSTEAASALLAISNSIQAQYTPNCETENYGTLRRSLCELTLGPCLLRPAPNHGLQNSKLAHWILSSLGRTFRTTAKRVRRQALAGEAHSQIKWLVEDLHLEYKKSTQIKTNLSHEWPRDK